MNKMSFIKIIENDLKSIINEVGYELDDVVLSISNRPDLGDYQINDAMKLAKIYHTNPMEIANKIVTKLKEDKLEELFHK